MSEPGFKPLALTSCLQSYRRQYFFIQKNLPFLLKFLYNLFTMTDQRREQNNRLRKKYHFLSTFMLIPMLILSPFFFSIMYKVPYQCRFHRSTRVKVVNHTYVFKDFSLLRCDTDQTQTQLPTKHPAFCYLFLL